MGARYKPVLNILVVLAFLAACGFILQRRAAIDDGRRSAQMRSYYQRDIQSHKTEMVLIAAYRGDVETVRRFLPNANSAEAGGNVNGASREEHAGITFPVDRGYSSPDGIINGHYLLSVAAAFGYTDLARLLQTRHLILNATDRQEALALASACGHADMVRFLLDFGADANAPADSHTVAEYTGLTPLMLAAGYGHTEVVRLLLKRHVKVNVRSPLGRTALTYARRRDLPPPPAPSAAFTRQKLPQRAADIKHGIDRTDDPVAVVKLLRGAGANE